MNSEVAEKRGINIGVTKGKKEMARNLLRYGMDIEIVIKSSGLTKEEIEELKDEK